MFYSRFIKVELNGFEQIKVFFPGVGGPGRRCWRLNMFSSAVVNLGQTLDYVCPDRKKISKKSRSTGVHSAACQGISCRLPKCYC